MPASSLATWALAVGRLVKLFIRGFPAAGVIAQAGVWPPSGRVVSIFPIRLYGIPP